MYFNFHARSLQRTVELFTVLEPHLGPICEVAIDATGARLHTKNGETIRFASMRCGYAGAETEALAEILEIAGFGSKAELFNLLQAHRLLNFVPGDNGEGYTVTDSRTTLHPSLIRSEASNP